MKKNGDIMGLFGRKWKKKDKDLDEKYRKMDEPVVMVENEPRDSSKTEQYIIERLEQVIELAREVEDEKEEYKRVTAYLNDIQTIENLSEEERKKITETAVSVVQLNSARDGFLHSSRKLTDAQFVQLDQEKEEIPNAIKRLSSNEVYCDTLKKDLNYLEREKSEWLLHKEYIGYHQKKLKNLLYILIGIAVTAAVVLLLLQLVFQTDVYYAWMLLIFLAVVSVCIVIMKMQNNSTDAVIAEKNINRAIVLQNKVKIKYVNIANAIDYSCEKYHVRNAKELNQLWEYYMEAVREREKYQRTNEDLEYFNGRLVRILSQFKLYDTHIWINQALALIEPKEMVEVKHALVVQRQKLRERIKFNLMTIRQLEKESEQMAGKLGNDAMRPQIQEILQSIHKLSKVI